MASNDYSSDRPSLTADEWRRICAVLDRVLDSRPSDQQSALEDACRIEGVAIAHALRYLAAARDDAAFLGALDPVLVGAALAPPDEQRSLSAGTYLGQYEVLAPIGAGGMAEVYRAHDTTLHRDVALKVLRPRFASDAEGLTRFKREAHMLASLNHPNIAAIYGFEEFASTAHTGEVVAALALELVEGPTLAERLAERPLACGAALSIALQIADSLDAAHDAGIVHRDLKPANIKLRDAHTGRGHDVVVKVLDFGVAKALKAIEPDGHTSMETGHTANKSDTRCGAMIGTAAYMAPEQIDGTSIDRRADIWAFGCILYEMLTGVRAFNGRDVPSTLDLITTRDPDWTRLPADTPASLHRLLRRCLEKDRRRRLAHIADARLEIDEAEAERATAPAGAAVVPRRRRAALLVAAAVVLIISSAIAGWRSGRQTSNESALVTRLAIPILGNIDQPAVSADGSQVAFVSRLPTRRIVLRRLDRSQEQSVSGTEDATAPSFSPDGKWLAYRTTVQMEGAEVSRLKKIQVTGGRAVTLVDSVTPNGGDVEWGEDGYIYFANDGISRVSSAGGAPQRVVARDEKNGELGFSHLRRLPGGDWLLFTVSVQPTGTSHRVDRRVVAFNVKTGERRMVMASEVPAAYAQTGHDPASSHLLYERDGALFAVPFDATRIQLTGTAVRVIERDDAASLAPNLPVGISRTGTLAYVVRRVDAAGMQPGALVWADRHGIETPINGLASRLYATPTISPDGKRAAVNILRIGQQALLSDIWTYDFALGRLTRATFDGRSIDGGIVWTSDGSRLIYAARSDVPTAELTVVSADGSDNPERLQHTSDSAIMRPDVAVPGSVSPDGKFLIGTASGNARPGVFRMVLDPAGRSAFEPLLDPRMVERNPKLSPNGRWIAYESNRSGRREIWVAPHPTPDGKWQQVSTDGGSEPKWSSTGRELFYRNGNKMMAAAVDTGTSFHSQPPKVLFEGNYQDGYDVASDASRFLMIKPDSPLTRSESQPQRELRIVVNWFEELRRSMPVQH
jgi:eukaryotic-like serine/threonine-protein kinase